MLLLPRLTPPRRPLLPHRPPARLQLQQQPPFFRPPLLPLPRPQMPPTLLLQSFSPGYAAQKELLPRLPLSKKRLQSSRPSEEEVEEEEPPVVVPPTPLLLLHQARSSHCHFHRPRQGSVAADAATDASPRLCPQTPRAGLR